MSDILAVRFSVLGFGNMLIFEILGFIDYFLIMPERSASRSSCGLRQINCHLVSVSRVLIIITSTSHGYSEKVYKADPILFDTIHAVIRT